MSRTSITTVTIQLLCIILLVLTGPVVPRGTLPRVIAALGLAVILWAVIAMGIYNLRVEPDVAEHAKLVTRGPYRFIRHPMYTGGTLIAVAWLWDKFTWLRLIGAMVLIADFVVKFRYEEKLLTAKFPEYSEYIKRTKKLVPWVY